MATVKFTFYLSTPRRRIKNRETMERLAAITTLMVRLMGFAVRFCWVGLPHDCRFFHNVVVERFFGHCSRALSKHGLRGVARGLPRSWTGHIRTAGCGAEFTDGTVH